MATPSPKSPTAPTPSTAEKQRETAVSTNQQSQPQWQIGLLWGLLSPVFLGLVPILAKVAYAAGVNVLTVVAFRTIIAALFLWAGMLLFKRELIRSSTPAILGSMFAGAINGLGSIFFYASLTRIDASLGQLVNISYLVFVTVFLRLAGQTISLLTIGRTMLTIGAIYLLTRGGAGPADWLGVGMMLFAAITYAIQLVLSQRIMLDIPAPTMALYAITAMAIVVSIAWLFAPDDLSLVSNAGWQAIGLMALVTALSRLTLFLGVKAMGSIQTALLGVLEVVVTIVIAAVFLGERLSVLQWVGAAILMVSIFLVRFERGVPRFVDWWQFLWRRFLPKQ
ncbi:MAG: multidrug transporter [Ardenticatenaceae bacterium]|nr:MAG: multidrug transporter [Ardenticatenaceae bacterium]